MPTAWRVRAVWWSGGAPAGAGGGGGPARARPSGCGPVSGRIVVVEEGQVARSVLRAKRAVCPSGRTASVRARRPATSQEAGAGRRRTEAVQTADDPTQPTDAPRRPPRRRRAGARSLPAGAPAGRAAASGSCGSPHDERLDRAVAVKRIVMHDAARRRARRARGARRRAARAPGHRRALRGRPRRRRRLPRLRARARARRSPTCIDDGALSDRDVLRIGIALCDALDARPRARRHPPRRQAAERHRPRRRPGDDLGAASPS